MSKSKNYRSLLEPVTGKVGPVIFYFWNGIYCVRSKPSHYRDRNSVPQQRNRQRFNLMVHTLRELLPVVQVGFSNQAHQMSAYNKAFSENYRRALLWDETSGEYTLHPERLLLSKGLLPEVSSAYCVKNEEELHFQWADNSAVNRAHEEDRILIFLYNQDRGKSLILTPEATRKKQSSSITLPKHWGSDKVHVYLAFGYVDDEHMEHYSNSLYVTTLNQVPSTGHFLGREQGESMESAPDSPGASTDQSAFKNQSPQVPPMPLFALEMLQEHRNGGEVP